MKSIEHFSGLATIVLAAFIGTVGLTLSNSVLEIKEHTLKIKEIEKRLDERRIIIRNSIDRMARLEERVLAVMEREKVFERTKKDE